MAGANDKIVLALMGGGGRGTGITASMCEFEGVETKYVCDVRPDRGPASAEAIGKAQGKAPEWVKDYARVLEDKDVDAVVVATPEHWHALASIQACQAGKDVYVEKNICNWLWESRKMIEAAEKYGRVVQCGTQNRSAACAFSAREYIASGKLGRVTFAKVFNMLPGGPWQPQPDTAPPEGFDWDAWLGPAPKVPFNPGRLATYDWWDYSGGNFAADTSHQFDLARMVLGDPTHPRAVYSAGGRVAYPDGRETPDLQVTTFDYGDLTITCESTTFASYMSKTPGEVRCSDEFPTWFQNATRVEIYGTDRMMLLGRHGGGWQVFEGGGKIVDQGVGYFPDKEHQQNWFDAIRSRRTPNGSIEHGHETAVAIHMANISLRVGCRQLLFDPETETFTNSDEANALIKPSYRDGYRVPDEV